MPTGARRATPPRTRPPDVVKREVGVDVHDPSGQRQAAGNPLTGWQQTWTTVPAWDSGGDRRNARDGHEPGRAMNAIHLAAGDDTLRPRRGRVTMSRPASGPRAPPAPDAAVYSPSTTTARPMVAVRTPVGIRLPALGVEAPARQGARSAHTGSM